MFKPVTPMLWRSLNHLPQFYLDQWSKMAFRKSNHVDLWEWMLVLPPLVFSCAVCWIVSDISNALLLLFIQSSALGLIPAVGICTLINDFRTLGYYDLVSLTPRGGIGASWMIAVRYVRRSNVFFLVNYLALILQIAAGMAAVVALLVGLESLFRLLQGDVHSFDDLLTVFNVLMILLLLRLDYIYSIVTAMLIGVVVPTVEPRRRVDAGLMALAAFLLLQFAVYGVFSSGAIVLAEAVIPPGNGLLLSWIRVGVYVVMREMVVMLLWYSATQRLNTDEDEFRRLGS